MTLRRSVLPAMAIVLAAMSTASAQFAPPGGKPPCFDDFTALRDEAQKRMKTAHEAGQRKAPAPEMCKLIGHYAEAEAKLLKFVEDNGVWCGMPAQLAEQVKAGQAKTSEARKRICSAATAPKPSTPTLSDSLGTTRVADPSKPKAGTGTFDTLTGSIPAR
jgi:hypothetical protein